MKQAIVLLALLSTTANAQLYSNCPAGNCTPYQSMGSSTPIKQITSPITSPVCNGSSSTTYYTVTLPATYVIDTQGIHLKIPHIKDSAGDMHDNQVLLGGDGRWTVEKLNGFLQ